MDDIERLERLATQSLQAQSCPSVERLIAYAEDMLPGTEHLIVSAHVRLCPLCTWELMRSHPPDDHKRWPLGAAGEQTIELPGLRARPLRLAIARLQFLPQPKVRTSNAQPSAATAEARRFVAADVVVTLTVAPPVGERWQVTGRVSRTDSPLADREVVLRAGRRSLRQTTNDQGLFTFAQVPPGRYTFTFVEDQVQIQIRNLDFQLTLS